MLETLVLTQCENSLGEVGGPVVQGQLQVQGAQVEVGGYDDLGAVPGHPGHPGGVHLFPSKTHLERVGFGQTGPGDEDPGAALRGGHLRGEGQGSCKQKGECYTCEPYCRFT